MKQCILYLVLLISLNCFSQAASKVNNAQNVWTVQHDPSVLLECDPILSGIFRPRIKDSIYWETYNIIGLESYIQGIGDIRFKPISYTPTYGELIASLGYTPYNNTNPNGYISSESDPSVPAYSKTLTAFSVIKSSTDPLYKSISYVPSWTDITSKPTTLLGYGITDAYPLTGNPSNFLTSITSGQVTTALGFTPYNSTNPNSYINQADARTAISLTTTGIGISTYNNSTGVLNIPISKLGTPYSGVTNGSGNYTVVFSVPYSSPPNIQICLINPNVRDTPIPVVSTTGFTVNIQRRTDVIGLLPSYANVVGGIVNVLITEN